MLSLCLSTSPFSSSSSPSSSQCHTNPSSAPIPIGAHLEENGMARSASSSLSSSLESIRSSYSCRSSMERENERRDRRRLLDMSIGKIQGVNVPLRKHLLVFNAAKVLQKDLDALDEEDLYATLMEPIHSTMEVDNWAVFSEESIKKEKREEKMEVDETAINPANNIWQWMDNNEEQQMNSYSQDQEWSCVESMVGENESSSIASSPTWSLFSCMGTSPLWSSSIDDTSSSSSYYDSSSLLSSFESSFSCGDFSRVWGELSSSPLSSRDLLHLLPIQA